MESVFIMEKHYPYEGRHVMGVYSSMDIAKDTILPLIVEQNLKSKLCAAFYRWKNKTTPATPNYVSDRFYSFRNTWGLIKDTP